MGKVVLDREIETICEIAVSYPLMIGAKVGDRGFDLDDHEIARLAEAQKVRAASTGERKLDEGRIAELAQRAADAAHEQRG